MRREQFTFYRSYYEALKNLPKRDLADAIFAICEYSMYGTEEFPGLSHKARDAVLSIKHLMDTEIRLSEEGRKSKEYKDWRKSVFERDGFTCQICGARGVRLNAHHKKEYAYFPEMRYEISNGITLCVPCHIGIHSKNVHRKRKL